jgi:tRNA 2-thiouridine synthesizing protein A
MYEVDARGLSCPEPAMMAVRALREFPHETFKVVVSSATSKVNVTEMAQKRGKKVSTVREGDDYILTIE